MPCPIRTSETWNRFRTPNRSSNPKGSSTGQGSGTFRDLQPLQAPHAKFLELWNAKKKTKIRTKTNPTTWSLSLPSPQLLFNAKALSRMPTSRSDVMSTPGSCFLDLRHENPSSDRCESNSMLKVIKSRQDRKQRSQRESRHALLNRKLKKFPETFFSPSLNL